MHVTEDHIKSQTLSIEQHNAIDLLIEGMSDREVAEQAGVARETITRWRNKHIFFQAELNRRRQELWQAYHYKLQNMVGRALSVLENALENNETRAAMEILKGVKLYGNVPEPQGAHTPKGVLRQQAYEWATRKFNDNDDYNIGRILDKDKIIQEQAEKRLQTLMKEWNITD